MSELSTSMELGCRSVIASVTLNRLSRSRVDIELMTIVVSSRGDAQMLPRMALAGVAGLGMSVGTVPLSMAQSAGDVREGRGSGCSLYGNGERLRVPDAERHVGPVPRGLQSGASRGGAGFLGDVARALR